MAKRVARPELWTPTHLSPEKEMILRLRASGVSMADLERLVAGELILTRKTPFDRKTYMRDYMQGYRERQKRKKG